MREPVTVIALVSALEAGVLLALMISAGLVELVGTFCTSCDVTVVTGVADCVATGAALPAVGAARPAAIAKVDEVNARRLAVEIRPMYSLPCEYFEHLANLVAYAVQWRGFDERLYLT